LILNRPTEGLGAGIYHYDPGTHGLIRGTPASGEEIRYALNREDGVHNAPAVIVVAGDMVRQANKYSNRGWRYTLIEAGIASERIVDAATEAGLGSLVFGGYDDAVMSRMLFGADTPRVRTLVVVALGRPATKPLPDVDLEQLHNYLDGLFVGEGRLVEGTGTTDLWRRPGDLSFHQVLATIRSENDENPDPAENRTCGGTAASITAARAKAIVECVERHSSGNMRVDRVGPATEVNPGFDLSAYAALTTEQINAHHYLSRFDPDEPLQWVIARDLYSDAETFVPVDLVYYPLSTKTLGRELLTAANSSGIASHTDPAEAVNRALLELIERHAILTSWHTQLKPVLVPPHSLTEYLNNRRDYWHAQGYELLVLDYSTEGVPVAGIAIGSDTTFPAFAFGSAAAPTWKASVIKALHEAEVGMAGHRGLRENIVSADSIVTPIDHGRFHAYDTERTAWNFLKSAVTPETYRTPEPLDGMMGAIERFRPLAVRIDSTDPIHTYRVLSPRVFPISFGASLEHRPSWSQAPDLPHFIA
jgi:thiazole/oxazole-forming peptide maturase SagD family component